MHLAQTFTVPVGEAETFRALSDVPLIARCMAGVDLEGRDGDRHRGRLRARLGPISLTYEGAAWFEERDAEAKRFRVVATGSEAGGAGTAGATIEGRLVELEPDRTQVDLDVDLQIAGRPAQFGRGLITDVSRQLTDDFAARLASELTGGRDGAPAVDTDGDDVLRAGSVVPRRVRVMAAAALAAAVVLLLGAVVGRRRARG